MPAIAEVVSHYLSLQRPEFCPRLVHVGLVDSVALEQVSEYFGFPLSVSFHECFIFFHLSPIIV
jgi:hypothetical protein